MTFLLIALVVVLGLIWHLPADWLAGFNAKSTVDASPYNFATYRVRAARNQLDVSNSEGLAGNGTITAAQLGDVAGVVDGAVFESRIPGLGHLEATIRQATFDAANNPFGSPWNIADGFYYAVVVFYATAGPNWESASLLVNDVDTDGDVRGLQPVSFSGMSDGEYFINP